jgi:hypothetical protein
MTTTYTVTLTDAENQALAYETASQQDWIDNAVHNRCRIAIVDIVKIAVEKCFEQNIQVPASKEETVTLAYEQGWIKTVAQRIAESPTLQSPE